MSKSVTSMQTEEMCIGTWAWGAAGTKQRGLGQTWAGDSGNSKTENEAAFKEAVKQGCFFFDTAEGYSFGASEVLLGEFIEKAIKESKGKLSREDFRVATKFAPTPKKWWQSDLRTALEGSLARMKLEYVDLMMVHSPAFSVRGIEVWARALAECHEAGLIKEIGVSNYNADQIKRTVAELDKYGLKLASNQVEFSLLRTTPEKNGLLKVCEDLGVKVLAYSSLGMGRLTGKVRSQEALNKLSGSRSFGNCTWEEFQPILAVMDLVAEKHDVDHAQVALAWVKAKGCIPISGGKNARQVASNLAARNVVLDEKDVAALDAVALQPKSTFFKSLWQD